MESTLINTAEDLAAIEGTPAYAAFMGQLAGSLWRLEKDDSMGTWKAIEDNSTVERFGFTRSDFPNAAPLTLPVYVATTPSDADRKAAVMAKFREDRRAMFALISGMGFAALATGDAATADSLVSFREGVKGLPSDAAVVAATTVQELQAALDVQYKALVAALPDPIKRDFKALAA
jgi:hypothetical protein